MASTILTPNLKSPPLPICKLSTKFQLRQTFNGTWLKTSKRIGTDQQFHAKHISKVFESRAADKDVSCAQDVELINAQPISLPFGVKRVEDLTWCIKRLLNTMEDGRISVSPYSTSWVALIRNVDGHDMPQFPSSLDWIVQHQLPDGSWGDAHFFCVYDRLVNTLACVIALHTWKLHTDKIRKGVWYVKSNIWRLEDACDVHMTSGFEVIFPTLLRRARNLGIDDLPGDDVPVLAKIFAARDHKTRKIPREVMHKETTTLLYSLEGFEDLDWERLLKLQEADGSFLTSPSSTAFAFMQTNDHNCLRFITGVVKTFNGGAPDNYPVDIFARLWAVDRLQRLGISRFFEPEIKNCLSYVYRYWNANGLYSARCINFSDLDDTSMGFRLLRLQGYEVDPNVLGNLKEGDVFCCHRGEVTRSTSPTYALYRASQIQFPGEDILEEAYLFSRSFLQDWLAGDQLADKWIISKDLPGEIKVGLEVPWYASLPRVEAAYYMHQHYGGSTDVWAAKTFYRMPDVNNDEYLELARLDFKRCQAQHQIELTYMQGWYEDGNVEEFGISRKELLVTYFLAAATIFEPERAKERILWAKTDIICRMIKTFFNQESMCCSLDQRAVLLKEFRNRINGSHNFMNSEHRVVNVLLEAIHQLLQGFDERIIRQLKNAWCMWVDEASFLEEAELLVTTINICSPQFLEHDDVLMNHDYVALSKLTSRICHHLSQIPKNKVEEKGFDCRSKAKDRINGIREDMQALTKLVLEEPCIVHRNIKDIFLAVAKTYYYRAYFDADTVDLHIFKVLFEPVV